MATYTPTLLVETEDHLVLHLDPVEAIKLVDRVQKVSFFIRSSVDLVTAFDDEGRPTRAYPGLGGNIPVSARVVRRMLADLVAFNERKAVKGEPTGSVEVARLGNCLFFG